MKKLIDGIVDFRKNRTEESRLLFAKLALGQKPDALFVACSDSRVVPNLFASTNPGDLFVVRNIGNLIPPMHAANQENSVAAVLEFALFTLKVSNIIVCGHSDCGAMQALASGQSDLCCSHLQSWLQYGLESLKQVREGRQINSGLTEQNQISQVNVLQQIEHLKTYSFVQERLENKQLQIHGWWFDIAKADVYCYEEEIQQFILIDEEESARILQRLQ